MHLLAEQQNKPTDLLLSKESLSFPRQRRLLTREDFGHVFEKAFKAANGPFVVLARPNDKKHPRLGVILSKKKIPKAVARNRVRRLIRESFRKHLGLGGLDLIIMPKQGIDKLSNIELEKGLLQQWQHCIKWVKQRSSL